MKMKQKGKKGRNKEVVGQIELTRSTQKKKNDDEISFGMD